MTPPPTAIDRRRFLCRAGAFVASAAVPTVATLNVSFAQAGDAPRLIVVILRGAVDGLAAAPAHGDPAYGALRRELAIPPPGAADGALPLDRTFGLHPSLQFLHERYAGQELLVFHAVASPYRDRSHFDGQNVLENGLKAPLGGADGWLNRALSALPSTGAGKPPEGAVAISQNVPLILRGDAPVLSKSPLVTPGIDEDLLTRLADLYSTEDWFAARLSEATQGTLLSGEGESAAIAMGAQGKAGFDRMGAAAQMAGRLLRPDTGPQLAVIEATGWDTHANQGASKGTLATRLGGLDDALRTLSAELGTRWQQTAVLIITEFGRTVAVNGTRGTDHGTGGCAFLVGGAVRGGRVITDWPGLAQSDLLDHRDLRPTTDLRSVFKAVLAEHLHIDAHALSTRIFPDSAGARPLQGLIRA